MPYELTNKSKALWVFSLCLLLLAVGSSAFNPVTMQFAWHGDLPELHWESKKHAPTFVSFIRDCVLVATVSGLCAFFARNNRLLPHWIATILIFSVMCNNIQLGMKELVMCAKDEINDFPHLWYLCVFHWVTGLLSLAFLMPLLLYLRRERMR